MRKISQAGGVIVFGFTRRVLLIASLVWSVLLRVADATGM
jgi:hypothetical protein